MRIKCLVQGHNTWCSQVHATSGLPLSGPIQQTTNLFFYYQENRIWHFMQWRQFAWNANPVFLEEWEKYFKMSSVENFTQSAKPYGLHKQIAHGSVHGKTYNKTCRKRRISLHTPSLHISSLIRAFANRMYLLQSQGLTKSCATSQVPGQSAQLHILIKAFADHIYLR